MERNFKLSNYLNPFVDAYNKAVEFNMSIDKKIKEIVENFRKCYEDEFVYIEDNKKVNVIDTFSLIY